MPVPLIVNGVGYNYPVSGDENWAENATNWAVAVTQNLSSLSAGLANVNAGIFSLADGSAAAPSLRFTNSPTTGVYRISPDVLGFTSSGVKSGQIDATGAWTVGPVAGGVTHNILGTLAVSVALTAATVTTGALVATTGNFSAAVSVASLASGALTATTGNFTGTLTGVAAAFSGQVTVPAGTIGAPGYAFTGGLTTGLTLRGTNSLGLVTNGAEAAFIDANGLFHFNFGSIFVTHTAVSTPVVLGDNDTIININVSGASTVSLPTNTAGRFIVVKDISGAASSNNVVISPLSGNIDGASSVTINTDYGSFIFFGDGTNWHAIASSGSSGGALRTVTGNTSLVAADNIVLVNQSAACTIILPAPTKGKIIEIKDFSGTATVNNITVSQNSSDLIDGQKTTVITQNYQSVRLVANGTNWAQL